MFAQRARDNLACVAFCGLVGGQDELVFDGHSCVIDHTGATIARAAQFREELLVCDVDLDAAAAARLRDPSQRPAARSSERRAQLHRRAARHRPASPPPRARPRPTASVRVDALQRAARAVEAEVYARARRWACATTCAKNGFRPRRARRLRRDRLGPRGLRGRRRPRRRSASAPTIMPSPYSSAATQSDARALAARARRRASTSCRSQPVMERLRTTTLSGEFAGREPDLTEENLQARIRGNLLMALSNKFGWLVLATGNKSEMSVGYTTLYGDLAGGFAVIKDVPKTLVYRLCSGATRPPAPRARGQPGAARRRAPIPTIDHRARAVGRAAPRPARRGLAAPLRAARPDPQGYVELDLSREQLIAQGLPAARRRAHDPARRPRRVQAPPGAPGIKITAARVRPRPAHADHQPLPGVSTPRAGAATLRACVRAAAAARRAVRARARRLRQHAAGRARSPTTSSRADRRPVTRSTGWAALRGPGRSPKPPPTPSGAYSVQYGNCLQGGQGTLRAAAAGGHLARQQLPARRRHAHPADRAIRGVAGQRRAGGPHDRDPDRRRRRRHLRHERRAGRAPPRRRSCRSTARRARRAAARRAARHRLRLDTPLPSPAARAPLRPLS